MTNKELIEKCKKYQKLSDEIKKKELAQKQIQEELKKELARKKVEEYAFAEKHPKLFKQFTKEGAASTRFLFGLIKR